MSAETHPFHVDLEALGYRLVQERRSGDLQYAHHANRYLVYWVHWNPAEDQALFTWELDIGQFMHDHGLQIGANETLNLFLFPQRDARGHAGVEFVVDEMERTDQLLRSLSFV